MASKQISTISAGASKQNRRENMDEYEEEMENVPEEDRADFMELNLGMVGEYGDLKMRTDKNGKINADHIPPKDSYKQALVIVEDDLDFQRTHQELYEELKKSRSKTGYSLLCMEVLAEHHTQALTTGPYKEAKVCRKLMAEALSRGEVEKTLKMAFITAHPETSQKLKNITPPPNGLSTDYYQVGYRLLIDKYFERGLIDSNVDDLHEWVNEKKYMNENEVEYKSIEAAIFARNQL